MRRLFASLLIALGLAAQSFGATTAFSLDDPVVVKSGLFTTTGAVAGQYQPLGRDSQFDFAVTGTACSMSSWYLTALTDFKVSVDGGAYAAMAGAINNYDARPLFTGLSDASHTVSIKASGTSFSFVAPANAISVTGAAPAISAPSGFGTQYVFTAAGVSPYVAASPGVTVGSSDGYPCYTFTNIWPDMEIDLPSGSCGTLKLWTNGNGQKYTLRVDGVNKATVTASTDTVYRWLTLATGLPATGTHTYSIHQVNNPTYVNAYAVMTIGGSGLTGTAPAQARECWAYYGDSITVAAAGTGDDSSLGYASLMTKARGVWCVNRGWGGTLVWSAGGGLHSGEDRTSDLSGLTAVVGGSNVSVTPTQLIVLYGVNDFLQVAGAESTTTFQASFTSMLSSLKAILGADKITCLGLLDRSGGITQAWRTAQGAGAASQGIRYIPTEGWINTTTDSFDGLHPNGTGYAKLAAKLLAIMPPVARPPVKPSRSR